MNAAVDLLTAAASVAPAETPTAPEPLAPVAAGENATIDESLIARALREAEQANRDSRGV